ncbi:dTMP kinase [uncultured Friedmanniella sp.]|uniref:dTMP kinase n=1 Tax=uncultured Friedmanniella sp. TaxID=335381 RepID=UPI0035CBC057
MSGAFVVFEGGDGVGKTTQVDRLCRRLERTGREVVRTFEPGDSPAGHRIRALVLDPATGDLDPRAEALLYAADKAQHLHAVVRPALDRGAVVVCDRYVDSMLAYQGAGRVLAAAEVEQVARWATQDLRPDVTVLLDVDPRQAVQAKADLDRVEAAGLTFHERARAHFLELAGRDPSRYLVLAARRGRDELAEEIWLRVQRVLSRAGGGAVVSPRSGRLEP